jgi:hypothetical protein
MNTYKEKTKEIRGWGKVKEGRKGKNKIQRKIDAEGR